MSFTMMREMFQGKFLIINLTVDEYDVLYMLVYKLSSRFKVFARQRPFLKGSCRSIMT